MKKRSDKSNPRDYKGLNQEEKDYLSNFDKLEKDGYGRKWFNGVVIDRLNEVEREIYFQCLKDERNGRRRDLLSKRDRVRRLFEDIDN